MKVAAFFKILNKKIEKYNRMATNPFTQPQPIVLIWVEEEEKSFSPKEEKDFT